MYDEEDKNNSDYVSLPAPLRQTRSALITLTATLSFLSSWALYEIYFMGTHPMDIKILNTPYVDDISFLFGSLCIVFACFYFTVSFYVSLRSNMIFRKDRVTELRTVTNWLANVVDAVRDIKTPRDGDYDSLKSLGRDISEKQSLEFDFPNNLKHTAESLIEEAKQINNEESPENKNLYISELQKFEKSVSKYLEFTKSTYDMAKSRAKYIDEYHQDATRFRDQIEVIKRQIDNINAPTNALTKLVDEIDFYHTADMSWLQKKFPAIFFVLSIALWCLALHAIYF